MTTAKIVEKVYLQGLRHGMEDGVRLMAKEVSKIRFVDKNVSTVVSKETFQRLVARRKAYDEKKKLNA